MCLLASLILSSGQVTAMAQPWDNVENMETVQQNITDAQSDIISESDIQSPEDWDPEDPQNARAYEQLMESTDAEDASQTPVLYSADARAAAVTTTWGGKTYTHNDFNTEDCDVVPCIDVSYHQGTIDWTKVKNAGIAPGGIGQIDAGRPSGQDDPNGVAPPNLLQRKIARLDLGIDRKPPHPSGDELFILPAKVQYQHQFVHSLPPLQHGPRRSFGP